jgi:prolyl-tRNA editing enzyme YbaK/EbsC (Cys-tRNA(Pro) deacylase)
MHPSANKIQDLLEQLGLSSSRVVELTESTRTAREAAQALGCNVGQIAKSLVFRTKSSRAPVLVIVSGANRVKESLFKDYLGEPLERADPDYVRELTGFSIGGVPPVGHKEPLRTYLDKDLLLYTSVWAAAGTPNAVFNLTVSELRSITRGEVVAVS